MALTGWFTKASIPGAYQDAMEAYQAAPWAPQNPNPFLAEFRAKVIPEPNMEDISKRIWSIGGGIIAAEFVVGVVAYGILDWRKVFQKVGATPSTD